MELKEMTFDSAEGGISTPSTVTVKMTVKEALWVAIVSGKQRGESPHSGIFDCLVGDVFNRYWEDGTDEARKNIHVDTPPISYEKQDNG